VGIGFPSANALLVNVNPARSGVVVVDVSDGFDGWGCALSSSSPPQATRTSAATTTNEQTKRRRIRPP
jgi:hypothetical protein